jgi:hypothetical protein
MRNPQTTESLDLRDHMLNTYKVLRRVLFVVGFLLPIVLWAGGRIYGMRLQDSFSQYYHADENYRPDELSPADRDLIEKAMEASSENDLTAGQLKRSKEILRPGAGRMRDWFVGSLFVIGSLLIAYRGYTRRENWLLNIAGISAILVALFPMPWGVGMGRSWVDKLITPLLGWIPGVGVPSFHYICAVVLFLCLAGVCWTSGNVTLAYGRKKGTLTDRQVARYRRAYLICGLTMGAMPIAALFLPHIPTLENYVVFIVECIGVWAFASYWLIKSYEIEAVNIETEMVDGKVEVKSKPGVFTGVEIRNPALKAAATQPTPMPDAKSR